jgi:hypothetical protein
MREDSTRSNQQPPNVTVESITALARQIEREYRESAYRIVGSAVALHHFRAHCLARGVIYPIADEYESEALPANRVYLVPLSLRKEILEVKV